MAHVQNQTLQVDIWLSGDAFFRNEVPVITDEQCITNPLLAVYVVMKEQNLESAGVVSVRPADNQWCVHFGGVSVSGNQISPRSTMMKVG